jgi:hypothetical protein
MLTSHFILIEAFPGTIAIANLKNVIDIQKREVYKVACSFVLKLYNTA